MQFISGLCGCLKSVVNKYTKNNMNQNQDKIFAVKKNAVHHGIIFYK